MRLPKTIPGASGLLVALGVVLCLGGVRSAHAELVILTDGRFLKVRSFELGPEGERMKLDLATGGRLTLPLSRIERVVADEIPLDPDPVPEQPAEEVFSLVFEESQPVPHTPYGELIYQAARRHELNPELVAAMIFAESAFDPRAVSVAGARGLMQLMPATAERFGVAPRELFEPARNLEAGTRYLAWLIRRFDNDLPRVLAGYNAGEGAVDRYGGVPPYRETRGYLKRIYRRLGLEEQPL